MTETNHAITNAKGWATSIVEMIARLTAAEESDKMECGQCNGTGITMSASNAADEECPVCDGTGEIDREETADDVREEIDQSVLSVRVRNGWSIPGVINGEGEPEEYEILLSTGGPALRIYGQLEAHSQPGEFPELQWQDWGTPWTRYRDTTDDEEEAIRRFVSCFYFGE